MNSGSRTHWQWRWMLWLLWPAAASALINPNFTPIHLVGQSHTILELVFTEPAADGKAVAEVRAQLKGKGEAPKTVRIDPTAAIAEGPREAFNAAAEKGRRALLFIGDFKPESAEGGEMEMGAGGDKAPQAIAFLHINGLPEEGQWILLEQWEDDYWDMVQGMNFLLATFNGGTDQLARMIRYILADPEADVPVEAGAQWADPAVQAGRIEGPVAAAVPVWLRENAADLFVAAASGDRLYRWRDGAPADITGDVKLASKSALFAWGDFDGDGRLDLASFDGEGLALWRQSAEGVFAPAPLARPEGRILSLDTIAAGGRGAALLVGTDAAPLLGRFADGAMAFRAIAEPPADAAALGLPSKALAADFDGDHLPDVLQLGAEGSLFYRGAAAPGEFAAPQRVAVRVGGGPHGVATGDFDQDGLLDIFVASERRHFFWHNAGGGRFEEKLMESGEVSYKFTTDGVIAIASDFNNDGRLDLIIGYNASAPPYILYNRGFRSFAHALGFDLDKEGRFPAIAEGQPALCFADFDGDGADDAAAVLRDGGVWVLRRAVAEGGMALAVRAGVPAGETGPVRVVATRFDRPLGARLAAPGRPAIFGARHPGPVTLVWQYPGGVRRETEVILEDRPVNVRLDR